MTKPIETPYALRVQAEREEKGLETHPAKKGVQHHRNAHKVVRWVLGEILPKFADVGVDLHIQHTPCQPTTSGPIPQENQCVCGMILGSLVASQKQKNQKGGTWVQAREKR